MRHLKTGCVLICGILVCTAGWCLWRNLQFSGDGNWGLLIAPDSKWMNVCEHGSVVDAQYLIKCGKSNLMVRHHYSGPYLPIDCAAMWGRLDILRELVEAGISPEAPDSIGRPPLFWCAGAGSPNEREREARQVLCVRYLVHSGANVNFRAPVYLGTALHSAVATRRVVISQELIDLGCNLEIRDMYGRTALQMAVEKFDERANDTSEAYAVSESGPIIHVLIAAGANVDVKLETGRTVREVLLSHGMEEEALNDPSRKVKP